VLNGLRKVKRFHKREADLEAATGDADTTPGRADLKVRLRQAIDALRRISDRVRDARHRGFTHEKSRRPRRRDGHIEGTVVRARAKLRESLADFAGEWVT